MNKNIRTHCRSFTAAGSAFALALALVLPLSTAQANSDYIVYQGVAFNDNTTVASSNIALQFTILASDGTTVVYQETQAGVATTDRGFFFHQIGSGTPVVVDGSAATYAAIAWADGYKLKVEVDYANGITYADLGIQEFSSSVYAIRAKTATKLETARTIGGVSFDGSENIDLPGVNTAGTQNTTGSAASLTTARSIGGVSFNGAENIDLPGVNAVGTQSTSGNAATATKLETSRTINGVAFDGSADITAPTNLAQGTRTATAVPVTSSTGTSATLGAATTTLAGVMSRTDKVKLDGIAAGAQVNVATNLAQGTRTATSVPVTSSTGTGATLNVATTTLAGVMSSADKTKLDGIAAGAQVNIGTNLGITGATEARTITSSTGTTNAVIPVATATASGLVSTTAQTFAGNKTFTNSVYLSGTSTESKLGVGTTSPDFPIHVATTVNRDGPTSYFAVGPDTGHNTSTRDVGIYASRFIAGFAFLAFSDTRIKEDITPITNAISTLQALEPVSYTKIDKVANGNGLHYGFIAQDLEAVIPESVTKSFGEVPVLKLFDDVVFEEGVSYTILVKNGEGESQQEYTAGQERPEGEVFVINKKVDDFRTVDHNMILAQAVAAIKEQQVLIEALQDELEEIRKELRASKQISP